MHAWKYDSVHLGIPYSKVGSDDTNLIIPVLKIIQDFTIQEKVIACTINGGYNMKACQDVLWVKVTNTTIY